MPLDVSEVEFDLLYLAPSVTVSMVTLSVVSMETFVLTLLRESVIFPDTEVLLLTTITGVSTFLVGFIWGISTWLPSGRVVFVLVLFLVAGIAMSPASPGCCPFPPIAGITLSPFSCRCWGVGTAPTGLVLTLGGDRVVLGTGVVVGIG